MWRDPSADLPGSGELVTVLPVQREDQGAEPDHWSRPPAEREWVRLQREWVRLQRAWVRLQRGVRLQCGTWPLLGVRTVSMSVVGFDNTCSFVLE